MIDVLAARKFIAWLTDDVNTRLTWQIIDDVLIEDHNTGKKKPRNSAHLRQVLLGSLDEVLSQISWLNERENAGVFIQVNDGARGQKNVTKIRAFFIDNDDPTHDVNLAALPPALIVQSSLGKAHYYWKATQDFPVSEWAKVQRHLAKAHKTDRSMINADRVMRLPGTWHMKDPANPRRVAITHFDRFAEPVNGAQLLQAYPLDVAISDPQGAADASAVADAPAGRLTPAAFASFKRVAEWLDRRGVHYSVRQDDPTTARLDACPFNAAHQDMIIRALPSGAIVATCFHNSCGGNTQMWERVKATIGGWLGAVPGFQLGDHVEVARRLLADIRAGESTPPVHTDRLYRYASVTGLWEEVTEEQAARTVMGYSGLPRGQSSVVKLRTADVNGALIAAKRIAAVPLSFFADAPTGIAFRNGFVRVSADGTELVPHHHEHRQTDGFNFDFSHDYDAPRWAQFLREVFEPDADAEEKILLLQEFIGVCLIGQATKYQTAVMLLGEGANGKSVLINTVSALFPPRLVAAIRPQLFGEMYHRAQLYLRRLNAVSEVPEADILAAESWKAITDGSRIDARSPYGQIFMFAPIAGQLYAANRLPGTIDFSGGFWRRWVLILFNRSFGPDERDPDLEAHLIENELPGIAAWALRGAARLLATGRYTQPPSSDAAKEAWRKTSDVIALFLDEDCELTASVCEGTLATPLYDAFRSWLTRNGHRAMSSTKFGCRLKALGIPATATRQGTMYPVRVVAPPPIVF